MIIPLKVLRAGNQPEWLAQFARVKRLAEETDIWAHSSGQTNYLDSTYAGRLRNLRTVADSARTAPRVGLYGLAEAAAPSAGGSTSRIGVGASIPITQTSSFVATVHPDFSNVEADQQTIAPTTFQRFFNEVRPFFAQSTQNVAIGDCYACVTYINELYTPTIPAPRDGYALEGKQGQFTFGAFDAVGRARTDAADTIQYNTPDKRFSASETLIQADQPGVHDQTKLIVLDYSSLRTLQAFADYGTDDGNLVADRARSKRYDAGILFHTKDDVASFSMRSIGREYSPGYSAQINHTFRFRPDSRFVSATFASVVDSYAARYVGTNQADGSISVSLTTRTKFTLATSTGFSFTRLPGDILRPANQQGFGITYQAATALQSQFIVDFGRFGDGRLTSLNRDVSFRLLRRSTVSINADDTRWRSDDGTIAEQWLERASPAIDLGPRSSLTFGGRKIIGTTPPFGAPGIYENGTNLSFGYFARRAHDDLYIVYGDASQFETRHALTIKFVHFFGAEKGT